MQQGRTFGFWKRMLDERRRNDGTEPKAVGLKSRLSLVQQSDRSEHDAAMQLRKRLSVCG